jgi:hypothetical protein
MDNILEQLITVPNILFCIIVALVVMGQRKAVEYFWKTAKDNHIWNELLLPLGPIGTGAGLAAVLKMYPFPEVFVASLWNRLILGAVCGLASAHVYKIAKKFIQSKEGTPETP